MEPGLEMSAMIPALQELARYLCVYVFICLSVCVYYFSEQFYTNFGFRLLKDGSNKAFLLVSVPLQRSITPLYRNPDRFCASSLTGS